MSLIRKTFINKNRVNRFLKQNTDEWNYEFFNLDRLKIRVKEFYLHGKCVCFYLYVGNCHAIKDYSKRYSRRTSCPIPYQVPLVNIDIYFLKCNNK